MDDSSILSFTVQRPYITVQQYADLYGISPAAVRKRVRLGKLPVLPREKGEHIMINHALILKKALEAKY